jgi:hypothetical protein
VRWDDYMAENRKDKISRLGISDGLDIDRLLDNGNTTKKPVNNKNNKNNKPTPKVKVLKTDKKINKKNMITLNEFIPLDSLKEITTGSELLLAYELGKYAKEMLGKELSLSGVNISKDLLSGEHFSFVVNNGLDVGFEPDRTELADYSRNAQYFFTKKADGVDLRKETKNEVVYSFEHNTEANHTRNNRSAAYVSLVAYLMVNSKHDGAQMPKLIIDHETYTHQNLEYVDLFILKNHGNEILKDLVEIKYSQLNEVQPDWEAFVMYHRQKGLMDREYSITEKFNHVKENFEVKDVVLYYERVKPTSSGTIKKLTACYPAVIREINENSIKLSYYPIIQTRLTRHMELAEIDQNFEDEERESIYTKDDYERFDIRNETIQLAEIGVDTCTWIEQSFFIKPIDFDGSEQTFKTKDGVVTVWLSTLDAIYAVFEDRGINDYNKEKFLRTYFQPSNRQPVYDQYVQASKD